MSKESQQVNPYPIRLTKELRERLEAIAKANGRSLNAEMILRLEASIEGETDGNDIEEKIRQIALEVVREELSNAGVLADPPERESGFSTPMQRKAG